MKQHTAVVSTSSQNPEQAESTIPEVELNTQARPRIREKIISEIARLGVDALTFYQHRHVAGLVAKRFKKQEKDAKLDESSFRPPANC